MPSGWPVGLSTGCFHDIDIRDCLEPIRHHGFEIIEVCSSPRHLDYHDKVAVNTASRMIRDLWLEPHSFHAPFADEIDITSFNSEERRRASSELVAAAEAAAIIGAEYYVVHPGPERDGIPEDERFARLNNAAGVLDQIDQRCRQLGLKLVLENMLPHLFSGPIRDLLWVLGSLKTTGVGICLDTGHAYLSRDLHTVVAKLSGHLWMVHVNDNNGHQDDHLTPGDGIIQWRSLLAQLVRRGFAGSLILEIRGLATTEETLISAQRGRRHLRAVSRQLDPRSPE